MRLLQVLAFSPFFVSPVFSQGLQSRLNELGLDGFSQLMATYNPTLLEEIGKRDDITVWAPGNALVDTLLATVRKRDEKNLNSRIAGNIDHKPGPPKKGGDPSKRQVGQGPPGYPDSNFETIITFLNDTDLVNLGPDQQARFTKNYAAPLDGGSTSASTIEVVTGLGNTQNTLRGPFKFTNGVIYEVNEFFTMPAPFTVTMEEINLAQGFYNTVVSSGKLSVFKDTPAITVFAPIDGSYENVTDPEAYLLSGPRSLYYSPAMIPGNTIITTSGDAIYITMAANGERLLNCRRLVRPNIPMKNGVIHFIDGSLYESGGCNGNFSTQTNKPPPVKTGAAARQGTATATLILAFAASLLAFY
ncbi:hypothetical protein EV426DRAFT_721160 [Tirmania nivea]|nr:hypothetical protein EV426DRAFT_721160 [Tirmania nivea]